MRFNLALSAILGSCTALAQHVDFSDYDYRKLDSMALNYSFEGNLDPVKIASDLTQGLTSDIEKYRVIFRWITANVAYDVKLYLMDVAHDYDPRRWPNRARRWHKKFKRLYLTHTIKQRMTICEGYAWLLETMCRTVGLSCEVIHGYGRQQFSDIGRRTRPNHAWNAVMINNKWYLCDPTWASGGVNEQFTKYIKDFDEVYFLARPEDFIANHYPLQSRWTLLLEKPTLDDFVNAPIMTTAFLKNQVVHYFPKKGRAAVQLDSLFSVSVSMNRPIRSLIAEINTFRNSKSITTQLLVPLVKNEEGYYVISHAFSQRGEYDLRIYLNRQLTFIYKIFVR